MWCAWSIACAMSGQRLNLLVDLETGWADLDPASVTEEFATAEILKSEAAITNLIEGVDMNQNNQIEGFPGECGLRQIPAFGLLVGSIDLVEGDLS